MKIAAFNVKKLGWTKVNKEDVQTNLIRIMSRYSVVVILEVVDSTGRAMKLLLRELNNTRENRNNPFAMMKSVQLGRSSYKEQFVFFYREDEVEVVDTYQYKDDQEGDEDAFAREPFILQLKCLNTVVEDLVLIPVHTTPMDVVRELNALDDVVKDVRRRWSTDNIMLLGDFNADGRYLSSKKKKGIRISCYRYKWLIDEDADTTTSDSNDHTYDRIVVTGDDLYEAIVPGSAQPFNFQKAYRLSTATTRAISDHYPVEVELIEK
ncbi:deoxyribonuclease-1-like [Thunnus thynnus]|uniref:deoxyribonuclease-1-like n=1 Tax=Thunnus thynnus TaxID=8237 RepID=UPI0035295328